MDGGPQIREVGRHHQRWWWVASGLTPVAVTLVAWTFFVPVSFEAAGSPDYQDFYQPVARTLLEGGGIRERGGKIADRYPPGYPLALAGAFWLAQRVSGEEEDAVRALNLVCMALSSLALFALSSSLWGAIRGWATVLLWSTYPPLLWLSARPSSELPFVVCLFSAIALYGSLALRRSGPGWYFLAGSALGVAMLIRPIAIGLGALLALLTLLGSSRGKAVAGVALLIGSLAPVLPWELYVHRQSGAWIPLAEGRSVASIRDGLTYAVSDKGYRRGVWVPDDVRAVQMEFQAQYPSLDSHRSIAEALVHQARRRPGGVVKLLALKMARAWYGTDSQRWEGFLRVTNGGYLALAVGATVVAIRRRRTPPLMIAVLWGATGYFWIMNLLVLPLARYMIPAMGLLLVLAPALLTRRPQLEPGTVERTSS